MRFAFTDRCGGSSRAPYDEPTSAGTSATTRRPSRNRAALAELLSLARERVVWMNQVHGQQVVQVDRPWSGASPRRRRHGHHPPGLALAVLVADCVPVLLADPDAGVVAAAHAGRPGLAAGVVPAAVAAMRDLGARRITARLGPSVCRRCYEVPAQMRADVASVAPEAFAIDRHGRPALDIAAGVLAQLTGSCADLDQLPGCTRESPALYSHRRDGVTGRFAGLVMLE